MRVISLALLLCVLFNARSFSQDSAIVHRYDRFTIQYNGDYKFYIGSAPYKKKQIDDLLAGTAASAAEFALHKKNTIKSGLFGLGSLAFLGAGLLVEKHNETLSWVFLGGGVACGIVNIPFQLKAKKHFQKAVWLYNRHAIQ